MPQETLERASLGEPSLPAPGTPGGSCDSAIASGVWTSVALELYRPYLRKIAQEEIPPWLQPKLDRSDLVQETLLRGHHKLATFSGKSPEELARWLREILRNHLANVIAAYLTAQRNVDREQPQVASTFVDRGPSPSQILLAEENRQRLLAALDLLPERERQVLLLYYRDDLSFDAIGQSLSLSQSGVRLVFKRAIQALHRVLHNGLTTPRPSA